MPHPLYALPTVRAHRRLTTRVLAERAGVTLPTLRRLERGGMPSYRTTRRLAEALRVQPHTLMHVAGMSWGRAYRGGECPDCLAVQARGLGGH